MEASYTGGLTAEINALAADGDRWKLPRVHASAVPVSGAPSRTVPAGARNRQTRIHDGLQKS